MKIVAIDSYGQKPTIREVPPPNSVAPDELLVRVLAAGMNPVDSAIAQGLMAATWPAKFPLTLGFDFAGTVERVGPAVKKGAFSVGDGIYGKLTDAILQQGAYGEYVRVTASGCVSQIPKSLGFAEAAALPTAAMTAFVCADAANLGKGMRVLLNGATGGVGSFTIPLLAKRGVSVIATAHDEAIGDVLQRGASTVINYRRERLAPGVRSRFPNGIDALIDLVSREQAQLEELAALVRHGGAVISTTGAANVDALLERGIRATNVTFQPSAKLLGRVTAAVDSGELLLASIHTYPFEDVDDALAELRSGHVHGKLVLATQPAQMAY
jgi:NADPH:quinone reductase-like Zn-dependent oxidoreductase